MKITIAQLRARGIDPNTGKRLAAAPVRKERGTGDWAKRKREAIERLPSILSLLGVESLPNGVRAKVTPGTPNGWEQEWLNRCYRITRAMFQPIQFQLAPGAWYTPDVVSIDPFGEDGRNKVICWEVKGFMREAAALRLKVVADKYPDFEFMIVRKVKGNWISEKVGK